MRVVIFVLLLAASSRRGTAFPEEPQTLWTTSPKSLCLINQNKTTLPFVPDNNASCRADAIAFCKPYFVQQLNCSFSSPEIITCLNDNFHLLTPECQDVLPCGGDIEDHCSHVDSGRNLIMECLRKAGQNESDPLAPRCLEFSECLTPSSETQCKDYPYDYMPPSTAKHDPPQSHWPAAHHDSSHHRILNANKQPHNNKESSSASVNIDPATSKSSQIIAKTGAAVRANAHFALFGALGLSVLLLVTFFARVWSPSIR